MRFHHSEINFVSGFVKMLDMMKTIGIPKALMCHRFDLLWSTFFEELGYDVVYSDDTDRAIMEKGEQLSVDECCLASKIYMGHVENLRGKCDLIFVPALQSDNCREGYCTKFQALPDLASNTFSHSMGQKPLPLLTCTLESGKNEQKSFVKLATQLGHSQKEGEMAYAVAHRIWEKDRSARAKQFDKDLATFKALRNEEVQAAAATGKPTPTLKPIILFVSHPYVAHDPCIGVQARQMLETCGAHVLLAEDCNAARSLKASLDFSKTMPWIMNRELCGTIAETRKDVDGIVMMSAFPCGPDSMTNEAIATRITGVPTLMLTVDAQSGTAGLETRIESFVDILQFQAQGGYIHE